MITEKICPVCKSRHRVELPHEWTKPDGKHRLEIVHVSQSTNIDGAKLEGMFPLSDDGQVIMTDYLWEDSTRVHAVQYRVPIGVAIKKLQAMLAGAETPTAKGTALKKTRADLETEAAERGITFKASLKDNELQQLIEKHDAEKK